MTYPLLVTAEVARVEILGITEHAWADWVKRKVVEPVPGTRLYARRDLETAHERAKDIYAKPDNTLRLALWEKDFERGRQEETMTETTSETTTTVWWTLREQEPPNE